MQRNDEGVLVFNFRDAADRKEAFSMLMESPVGVEYLEHYDPIVSGDEHSKLVAEAIDTLWPNNDAQLTVSKLATALRTLIKSGAIKFTGDEEDEVLPEPAATSPTDKNGKQLSSSQILWKSFGDWSKGKKPAERAAKAKSDESYNSFYQKQFALWSEDHSSSECRARARSDESYGAYYRQQFASELVQEIGDAVTPEGVAQVQVQARTQPATPELIQFAEVYKTAPASDLRPRGGFVSIGGQPMPWATYQDLLNKAIASGVIR